MPSREALDLIPSFRPEEKERPWQSDSWLPRHTLVCQLHAIGMRNKEISEITGYTPSKVSIVLGDPRARMVIQEALEGMASHIGDLHTRLKVHATEALEEIVDELRSSKDEKIRQRAAFGLLDRAGYTPVQKQIVLGGSIPKDVAERVESAMDKMSAIDAEYTIVESEPDDPPPGEDEEPDLSED